MADKKDDKRIVIVHSIAPYEDAKSGIGKIIGLAALIIIIVLFIIGALIYALWPVIYYTFWLWIYPVKRTIILSEVIGAKHGLQIEVSVFFVSMVLGIVIGGFIGSLFFDIRGKISLMLWIAMVLWTWLGVELLIAKIFGLG